MKKLATFLTLKIQPILKTDVRYLLRGGFYLGLGQVLVSASSLILTLCLVRILDQAEYGMYSYILSLAGVVGIFTHSGMDPAITQAVARGADRSVIRGFFEKFRWSIPVSLVALSVGGYYLIRENTILGVSIIVIGLTTPLFAASSLYGSYWNGKKQFKKLAFDNVFRNVSITLSILLAAYLTHDVLYTALTYFIVSTLISGVRFYLLTRRIPHTTSDDHTEALHFGKHMSIMDIIGNVSTYLDKIIVFQFLGATPLAFYALAMAPIKQMSSVTRIIRTLVFPKFSTRSAHELKALMRHKVTVFFFALMGVTILYCIFAELFFTTLFPEYHDAVRYSQVLSLSLLFMPSVLHLEALTALNRKRDLYVVNITKTAVRITLLIILVPLYGVWGAIMTYLLSQMSLSIVLKILFDRIKT